MRSFLPASLFCLLAWSAAAQSAPKVQEQPFVTEAEGSACMGDDKSRKETEEVARNDAKRRAAEQAATQVRAQSRVSIGTLEEDVIKIMAGGKVRVLQVLKSKWDKDGCYTYLIRAEVTPAKPDETPGVPLTEEEKHWNGLEDTPDLRGVDQFLANFPFSVHAEKAKAMQVELEQSYARVVGPYLIYRDTAYYLRPAEQSIRISELSQGEVISVDKIHDQQWAVIKRDVGQVYTPFANLRTLTDDETAAWARCSKNSKDIRGWQEFLQTYPKSHLARLAKDRLASMENRLVRDDGLSKQDSEEIALWNRCLKTRDLQCAREYRRRYPNGKFEKESWAIH